MTWYESVHEIFDDDNQMVDEYGEKQSVVESVCRVMCSLQIEVQTECSMRCRVGVE